MRARTQASTREIPVEMVFPEMLSAGACSPARLFSCSYNPFQSCSPWVGHATHPSWGVLAGGTYPRGVGSLVLLTHLQGRAGCAQAATGWAVGASSPSVVRWTAKGWNGLCNRQELRVASDSGLKSKPQCRKDWCLTCSMQEHS